MTTTTTSTTLTTTGTTTAVTMTDPTEPLALDPDLADDTRRFDLQPADTGAGDRGADPAGAAAARQRRPRPVVSARMRILGWLALLLVFAGATALLAQRRVLLNRLDDRVEDNLRQEVDEVRRLATGRNPETGEPFAGDVAAILDTFLRRNIPVANETLIALVEGRPPTATPAPHPLWEEPELVEHWSALTAAEWGEVSTPEGPVDYLAVPLSGDGEARGVFVVAYFLAGPRAEVDDSIRISALVYGSVLMVAVGLAWLVAGRVLRPVRAVSDTARELSETDLSRRIAVPDANDEIAELARTFNAMLDRLETAFADQRQFLDDAGHELRTPITVIRGHVELEGDDPDERRATRAVVLDELDRMARIVDDLLLLARAERPDFLQPTDVDLDLLTTELFAKCQALAERDWRLAGTGLGIVRADRQRLTQAVMNLADNAVRHTGPGDVIELGSTLGGGEAAIWLRDSGPGIPADQQERIFERFARDRDGGRRPGTAGLGLAIVRGIARAHGGRVALDSRPGRGATFTIVIPADDPDAPGPGEHDRIDVDRPVRDRREPDPRDRSDAREARPGDRPRPGRPWKETTR
jgi:two-component system, OmpR family, sensor kinase